MQPKKRDRIFVVYDDKLCDFLAALDLETIFLNMKGDFQNAKISLEALSRELCRNESVLVAGCGAGLAPIEDCRNMMHYLLRMLADFKNQGGLLYRSLNRAETLLLIKQYIMKGLMRNITDLDILDKLLLQAVVSFEVIYSNDKDTRIRKKELEACQIALGKVHRDLDLIIIRIDEILDGLFQGLVSEEKAEISQLHLYATPAATPRTNQMPAGITSMSAPTEHGSGMWQDQDEPIMSKTREIEEVLLRVFDENSQPESEVAEDAIVFEDDPKRKKSQTLRFTTKDGVDMEVTRFAGKCYPLKN